MNNFIKRNAITKTRVSSGNLVINTTEWYSLQGDMKIRENCKRKDKENNNIRRKALNDINEVGHINFQIGNNKMEKLKFFFSEVSSGFFLDSSWWDFLDQRNIQKYKKKLGSIYFQKLPLTDILPNSCSHKFSRITRKTPVLKSFFTKAEYPMFWLSKENLQGKTASSRDVCRTLQNNYNSPFSWKYYRFQVVTYFFKKALS